MATLVDFVCNLKYTLSWLARKPDFKAVIETSKPTFQETLFGKICLKVGMSNAVKCRQYLKLVAKKEYLNVRS